MFNILTIELYNDLHYKILVSYQFDPIGHPVLVC